MIAEIFLIADISEEIDAQAARLQSLLAKTPVSALLISGEEGKDAAYLERVAALAPIAQDAGVAVLLDNRPDLVEKARADGVHITGGIKALREALAALKPHYIVGTGDIGSRHEAMVRGELDVDYLMFGDRGDAEGRDMADWWAETFEVPSVYRVASGEPFPADISSEFIALAGAEWAMLDTVSGDAA